VGGWPPTPPRPPPPPEAGDWVVESGGWGECSPGGGVGAEPPFGGVGAVPPGVGDFSPTELT